MATVLARHALTSAYVLSLRSSPEKDHIGLAINRGAVVAAEIGKLDRYGDSQLPSDASSKGGPRDEM